MKERNENEKKKNKYLLIAYRNYLKDLQMFFLY